jgi:acetoin utilization deacetylase AcuC-like enzyme
MVDPDAEVWLTEDEMKANRFIKHTDEDGKDSYESDCPWCARSISHAQREHGVAIKDVNAKRQKKMEQRMAKKAESEAATKSFKEKQL